METIQRLISKIENYKEDFVLIILSLYIASISLVDLLCSYTKVSLYSDLSALAVVLVCILIRYIFKLKKAPVVILSYLGISLVFFFFGFFESHRLLFFIPGFIALIIVLKGRKKIITISFAAIIYLLTVFTTIFLPNILTVTNFEAGLSTKLWSLVTTSICVILLSELSNIKNIKESNKIKDENYTFIQQLDEFSKEGILVNFKVDKPYELKEEIGDIDYYLLFTTVFDYFKKLEDENTIVLSYGDDNILMYLKNRDMEYVGDLTEGVLISIHDDLNIKEPMYITASIKEKNINDDMESIVRKADERK